MQGILRNRKEQRCKWYFRKGEVDLEPITGKDADFRHASLLTKVFSVHVSLHDEILL